MLHPFVLTVQGELRWRESDRVPAILFQDSFCKVTDRLFKAVSTAIQLQIMRPDRLMHAGTFLVAQGACFKPHLRQRVFRGVVFDSLRFRGNLDNCDIQAFKETATENPVVLQKIKAFVNNPYYSFGS